MRTKATWQRLDAELERLRAELPGELDRDRTWLFFQQIPPIPMLRRPPSVAPRDAHVRHLGMSPREVEAYQLFMIAESGIERVRLCAGPDPGPECLGADRTEMTIEDAMVLAPIPHELGPGRWCRCSYRPVSPTR